MVVLEDSATKELLEAIKEAAKRGVKVTVSVDSYAFLESGDFLPFFVKHWRNRQKPRDMERSLRKSGVKFSWLGTRSTSLLSGRTHSKWLVVDDTVYSFGGVNLYERSLDFTDYMFRLENNEIATALVEEQQKVVSADKTNETYRSHQLALGDSSILIDGGIVGNSLIYGRACRLVERATDVLFVSQYCPNGRLAKSLKNKSSQLYFNRPQQASFFNRVMIRCYMLTSRLKTAYTRDEYLHAKYLICTMLDGSKVALTGSHNFSSGGVWFGTREIALETRDPEVIAQLEQFFVDKVK